MTELRIFDNDVILMIVM